MAHARRRSPAAISALAAPNGSSFIARYPRATTREASAAMASGSRSAWYQPFAYAGTRSRNRPPSSFHTGTPSAWPIRSQQATSKAASADWLTSSGRAYSARWTFHASRSKIERIRADHVARRELLDAGDERRRPVDHPDLGDAGQAGVRVQLDERQLPPRGADDRRAHAGDRRSRHARTSTGDATASGA